MTSSQLSAPKSVKAETTKYSIDYSVQELNSSYWSSGILHSKLRNALKGPKLILEWEFTVTWQNLTIPQTN